jgi:cytochrome c553
MATALLALPVAAFLLATRALFGGGQRPPADGPGVVHPLHSGRPVTAGKRFLFTALLLGFVGGAGGLVVAASGFYDVSAARGHWPITRKFLTFAMERSVAHHAAGLRVPPLDDPALLYLGLGHYDGACAPCHGAPGTPRNPVALGAVPQPPYLPAVVQQWEPQELFWITKRGLKYTGMPAWPATERDDEVWAVVAAMLRLPGLSTEEYRRMVRGEPLRDLARATEDAQLIATAGPLGRDLVSCARCHGLRGEGRGEGAFPPLAGQGEQYLYEALRGYALGSRRSGVMQPVATQLTDTDMRDLARYFAAMQPSPPEPTGAVPAAAPDAPAGKGGLDRATGDDEVRAPMPAATGAAAEADPEVPAGEPGGPAPAAPTPAQPAGRAAGRPSATSLVAAGIATARRHGETLAMHGKPDRHIPACASCHGPAPHERHPLYPALAGQPRFYLEQQLRLFRAAAHPATPQAEVMRAAARTLEEDDIRALALYYSGLQPERSAAALPATLSASPPGTPGESQ